MIFKRVVARLRAQDWMAIAIELAIVIMGVFIGTQVSNWNSNRIERAKTEQMARDLQPELKNQILNFESLAAYYAVTRRYGEAALAGWRGDAAPGAWVAVERHFRDEHTEAWWALEVEAGPYGPARGLRAVVATTDPATLPDHTTWYLATNLPPDEADLAEIVRLYGLRMWVEQGYKHMKYALGWAQYQVRSDAAIRRHWQLVCCAFSFCWWAWSRAPTTPSPVADAEADQPIPPASPEPAMAGRGKNVRGCGPPRRSPERALGGGAAESASLAAPLDPALALVARLVERAPAPAAPGTA